MKEFINQYPLSKTLRFSLKPQGKTLENIKNKNFLTKDEDLAGKYQQAKKIIDEYHKGYIDTALQHFQFNIKALKELQEAKKNLEQSKDDKAKKEYKDAQTVLRKAIVKAFGTQKPCKDFIKKTLPDWLKEESNQQIIEKLKIDNPIKIIENFDKKTTYFQGFYENRKNLYTDQAKSTAIAYRVIHDNLPKFINNIERYQKAKESGVDFSDIEKDLEKNHQIKLDDIFNLEYFNQCLTQTGIDFYNAIRGGWNKQDGTKIQGINQKINEHAQQLTGEQENEVRRQKKAISSYKLKKLYKQILSDETSASFRLKNIESNAELCREIESVFWVKNKKLFGSKDGDEHNISKKLKESIDNLKEANLDNVYIKNTALRGISQTLFGKFITLEQSQTELKDVSQTIFNRWDFIQNCLSDYFISVPKPLSKAEAEKRIKRDYHSFTDIHGALEFWAKNNADDDELKEWRDKAKNKPLFSYFESFTKTSGSEEGDKSHVLDAPAQHFDSVISVLEQYRTVEKKELKGKKQDVEKIKDYLDAIQDILHFVKPLAVQVKEDQTEEYKKDSAFYDDFDQIYSVLDQIVPLYNKVRNYLTQKRFSEDKYKLNFNCDTLAAGWSVSKEKDYLCVLFRKQGKYYLGIMDSAHKRIFNDKKIPVADNTANCYQKMCYEQVSGSSRNFPKNFFAKDFMKFNPSDDILRIRNTGAQSKSAKPREGYEKCSLGKEDEHKLIEYYQRACEKYYGSRYTFNFKLPEEYENIEEFFAEVDEQGYRISFTDVPSDYIEQCVEDGKLYLFEIYSKDFSTKTRGTPNLHTLYWRELFSDENIKDTIYKLNGKAELFYRKATIPYTAEEKAKGHHANDKRKKQKYPILKDRRYSEDTFLFHVPITVNFKQPKPNKGYNEKFNTDVNKYLINNKPNINILGIDRGERHLAYYVLINQKGEIIHKDGKDIQGSFNDPLGNKDYHQLLDDREKKRDDARKSWDTIDKIKDLKSGYLSQVVHKITSLMIEHNAIVVFEYLNSGFKRGRIKIEKQIYQKLEKMLIDKLNYLILKTAPEGELGSVRKAYQLAAPFESFKKLGKQTGFIFYVPAYYTSKVCPATGFVNLLYPRYETIKKSQEFFSKFDSIHYNKDKKYFEFKINYSKFGNKIKEDEGRQEWTICTYDKRLQNYKDASGHWQTTEVNITEKLKELFSKNNIAFESGENIKDVICQQVDKSFFVKLTNTLKLTLQMRNSKIGTDEDWMISPICKDDKFFDSREVEFRMPTNADANGAYHIARKGALMLQKLSKSKDIDKFEPDLSNKEWFNYIQQKD